MARAFRQLEVPVDPARDHIRGPEDAPVTLLAYADYQCPFCQKFRAIVQDLQAHLGDRLRVAFRHFPNDPVHPQAQLAAEAAEAAAAQGRFWDMHEHLYAHQHELDAAGLGRAASRLGLDCERFERELAEQAHASRVRADLEHGRRSGVAGTPTIFINGIRYDGPWDFESLLEAVEKPLGVRIELMARRFATWAASGGLTLLASALVALVWANTPWGETYGRLWETELSLGLGQYAFALSLREWVNDGLMVIFFFVVGLEIKREITMGELAELRRAALPLVGAFGGMLAPALIYFALNAGGPGMRGWGVPMATDIAFTLGLLTLLGRRVPFVLIVFVSALAIADDLGAILVIALFYTSDISLQSLMIAGAIVAVLIGLERSRIRRPWPYAVLGIALWVAVLASGVHPTIAGVLLAMAIPLRRPPDTGALLAQSTMALHRQTVLERDENPDRDAVAVHTLETVMERLESPAERIRRLLDPWTAYLILPLFALANAGIVLSAESFDLLSPVSLGILLGLVIGKPLGITALTWAATVIGVAQKPDQVEWRQLFGAGCLCGIGFTMSIFIATAGFEDQVLLSQAKLSVLVASALAGMIGWMVLMRVTSPGTQATGATDAAPA